MDLHPDVVTETDIVIRLDDDFRFAGIDVALLTVEQREPARLAADFDAAYSAAMDRNATKRAAASPQRRVPGTPTMARPALRSRPPLPDRTGGEPHWDLIRLGAERRDDLDPTGRSDNDCVRVSLDPASSRGRLVDVDAGWLAQTTPDRLESAVVEAFRQAYEKRGLR